METESSFVQLQARENPRISRNHQKLEENYGTDSSSESQETNPADALILEVWLPESLQNTFLLCQLLNLL